MSFQKGVWRVSKTHGQYGTKGYIAWQSMKTRCLNAKAPRYKDWGGRGITVCDRWLSFENFFADMGHPPAGCSLERRENDKGYDPSNCFWATREQQMGNTRRAVRLPGVSTKKAEIAASLGLTRNAINQRLRYGWTLEAAVSTPKKGG